MNRYIDLIIDSIHLESLFSIFRLIVDPTDRLLLIELLRIILQHLIASIIVNSRPARSRPYIIRLPVHEAHGASRLLFRRTITSKSSEELYFKLHTLRLIYL